MRCVCVLFKQQARPRWLFVVVMPTFLTQTAAAYWSIVPDTSFQHQPAQLVVTTRSRLLRTSSGQTTIAASGTSKRTEGVHRVTYIDSGLDLDPPIFNAIFQNSSRLGLPWSVLARLVCDLADIIHACRCSQDFRHYPAPWPRPAYQQTPLSAQLWYQYAQCHGPGTLCVWLCASPPARSQATLPHTQQ